MSFKGLSVKWGKPFRTLTIQCGKCWESSEKEVVPFSLSEEASPEKGTFSWALRDEWGSACTRKGGGVVPPAERAISRSNGKHHVWMSVCWTFPHYHTLREHHWVSGTFPEEQKDQLRPDPCPGVQGWIRKQVTCAHVVQNRKCNSRSVHELPWKHKDTEWLHLPGEGRESCVENDPGALTGSSGREEGGSDVPSQMEYHLASILVLGQSVTLKAIKDC